MCLVVVLQNISVLHYIIRLLKKNKEVFFPFLKNFEKCSYNPVALTPRFGFYIQLIG